MNKKGGAMVYRLWHAAHCSRSIFLLGLSCWILLILSGCASLKECAQGIAGVSTRELEDGRKDAITKILEGDYDYCYSQTKEYLKKKEAHIYTEDAKKRMIAIYVSREDTTPVGIFFRGIDASKIQIEVSSPSTYAKELIAGGLFPYLDDLLRTK